MNPVKATGMLKISYRKSDIGIDEFIKTVKILGTQLGKSLTIYYKLS
jgi:hypothetical protein